LFGGKNSNEYDTAPPASSSRTVGGAASLVEGRRGAMRPRLLGRTAPRSRLAGVPSIKRTLDDTAEHGSAGARGAGLDLAPLRAAVDRALDEFLRGKAAELRAIDPELDAQVTTVLEFVAGGKRLRPAFCYWGWRGAAGDPDDPRVVVAAAALELL